VRKILHNLYIFFRYDIDQGIVNLVRWFPIIWKDRNWDHEFLWDMLYKKLTLMERCLRDVDDVGGTKRADEIKVCTLLLKRLIANEYLFNAFKRHDERWGPIEMTFVPTSDENLVQAVFSNAKVKTEKDKKLERRDAKQACQHEDDLQKQDIDLLFKLMTKHVRGWGN